jgi:hypothetical protein
MSDKDYFWSELTRKNPRLLKDPHFTPESMRKFFDAVYDKAWNHGYNIARSMPTSASADMFSQIFGGFRK